MNKIHIIGIVFLLLLQNFAFGQYYQFEQERTAKYTGNKISCDDIGNLLIASKANLIKLDLSGNFIANYSPMFPGKITSINAKDPRRILLYFKTYSYVVFLNQDLTNAGTLSFYNLNRNPQPIDLEINNLGFSSLACLDEYNDAYWVYDANTSEIVLLDQENRIDFRGDALDELMDLEPQPNFMMMEANRLFINNPSTGVYIFDENGRFVRKLALFGLKKIQVHKDMLFYASNSFFITHNLITGEETYHPLPVLEFIDWSLNMNSSPARINFLTSKGVLIYSMEKNIK